MSYRVPDRVSALCQRLWPNIPSAAMVPVLLFLLAVTVSVLEAQTSAKIPREQDSPGMTQAIGTESEAQRSEENSPAPDVELLQRRTQLNLLGQVDTGSGESRRNENVQFNLIDNNALKELSQRLGTRATPAEEFQPDRNYFASEFGNPPTEPVHLPARSWLGGFHGRVYETHLNSIFSARSFFQVGDVQPARENDYGFEVTFRSLWRSFTTIRGNQQKIRGSVNGNVLILKPEERTPLATDPELRRIVQKIIDAYPAVEPNRPDINERMLNTNAPQHVDHDTISGRWDFVPSDADRLSFFYEFLSQKVEAFQLVKGQNPDTHTQSHQARITWTHAYSPVTLLDASVGFDRTRNLLVPDQESIGPSVVAGRALEPLGGGPEIPIDRAENLFRYGLRLKHERGRHSLMAGSELVRRQFNGRMSEMHRGLIFFSSDFGRDVITNLRMGTPTSYNVAIGHIHRGFRNWDMAFYVGDRWDVTGKLQLHWGLRYRPIMAPYEVNGLTNIPFSCDCNNLGPYLGIAYRLPEGWGIWRFNYAIHYGQIFPTTYQQLRFNPPWNRRVNIPAPDLVEVMRGLDASTLPSGARTLLYELDPNLVTPYSKQYSFLWQLELPATARLTVGYVGSRSLKLLHMWFLNRAGHVEGIPLTTYTVDARRPDPRYSTIRRVTNSSRGYYDAAKVAFELLNYHGVGLEASYWFGKALDLGANYLNTAFGRDGIESASQTEFDVHRDMKGLSNFDQPHAFLLRISASFPQLRSRGRFLRGLFAAWQLSGVLLLKSGTPFTVFTGSDGPGMGNVDGERGDRPNLLDPSILGRTIGNPDHDTQMLPRAAFGFIPAGQLRGTLGRNTFRKGPIRNVNAALSKSWRVHGDREVSLRAESINLLNTPQFAEPGFNLSEPNFGQITNTLNDGRAFRFQLAFSF